MKKCPLHRFGSLYKLFKESFWKCYKCGAFHKMDKLIMGDEDAKGEVEIKRYGKNIIYNFNGL